MEKSMKKSYWISRVLLAILTIIIFSIMFINEDESWRIIPFIFGAIVFVFSFPSTIFSKLIIKFGNKINNKVLKVLYYVLALPIISILLFSVICIGMYVIYDKYPVPDEMGAALGQALMFLFIVAVVFISIVLPYVQTLIVLLVNKIIKDKTN